MPRFQAPKGTQDCYPEEMAARRYILDAWRNVSIRNGFDEVDGPIFETLDLYKVKSGEGIVSELFHFKDRGDRELALRPEFTPTLARMVASRNDLSLPIKWFATPNLCRAENVQRGRRREFLQWNADILGKDDSAVDAELIYLMVDLFRELGLNSEQIKIKISHRDVIKRILTRLGVNDSQMLSAFELLDRKDKITAEEFNSSAESLGLSEDTIERFNAVARVRLDANQPWEELSGMFTVPESDLIDLQELHMKLKAFGIADWCEYDMGIVRGLAYYTGVVFEAHEASGAERAIAGGGRYDKLVKLMGGPNMPAVGMGMGDVVLSLVLKDKGLLPESMMPTVDVFIFASDKAVKDQIYSLAASLRKDGLHARITYKETMNVGKLLGDANKINARFAVIIENKDDQYQVKDLSTGDQQTMSYSELVNTLQK